MDYYALSSALVPLAWAALLWWTEPTHDARTVLTKGDGRFYLERATDGETMPPFHYRIGMPLLTRGNTTAWVLINILSVAGTGTLLFFYLRHFDITPARAFFGVVLFMGIPGLFRVHAIYRYFVDPLGNFLALLSAYLILEGHVIAGVSVSLLAGSVRETAPVAAALFSMSPWPLLGVLTHAGIRWFGPPPAPVPEGLEHRERFFGFPFKAVRDFRIARGLSITRFRVVVLPWGFALVALTAPTPWLIVSMMVGYAMLLTGTEYDRLYAAMCFPVVILHAVPVLPDWALWTAGVLQISLVDDLVRRGYGG